MIHFHVFALFAAIGDASACKATFCENTDGSGACCTLGVGRYGNCDGCPSHPNKILTSSPCPSNDRISYVKVEGDENCGVIGWQHCPGCGGDHWLLHSPGVSGARVYRSDHGHFRDNDMSDATVGCVVNGVVTEAECESTSTPTYQFDSIVHASQTGPTEAQITSHYSGMTVTAGAKQGYQEWVVPATGNYRIRADGAQGGGNPNVSPASVGWWGRQHASYGSPGARIEGTFLLNKGDVLTIVVGSCGGTSIDAQNPDATLSGGGGGSFVLNNETPLVIAGGGGGARITRPKQIRWGHPSWAPHTLQWNGGWRAATVDDNGAGRAVTSGGGSLTHTGHSANGGTDGSGGETCSEGDSNCGAAGGGLYTDGADGEILDAAQPGTEPKGGKSYANGLVGGSGDSTAGVARGTSNTFGGFGGGGGGNTASAGGGGGYSGGASCARWSRSIAIGGGGGSYNAGTDQTNTAGGAVASTSGTQNADGSVLITFLGANPTAEPSANPTAEPSANPTAEPSANPTAEPSANPTAEPSANPTAEPSANPTVEPSANPTAEPSANPTAEPSSSPTAEPSANPTAEPSANPTAEPSANPTAEPSANPTAEPSANPTADPSANPTAEPSANPTAEPSANPTAEPSANPTAEPSANPTAEPSANPTAESTTMKPTTTSLEPPTTTTEKTQPGRPTTTTAASTTENTLPGRPSTTTLAPTTTTTEETLPGRPSTTTASAPTTTTEETQPEKPSTTTAASPTSTKKVQPERPTDPPVTMDETAKPTKMGFYAGVFVLEVWLLVLAVVVSVLLGFAFGGFILYKCRSKESSKALEGQGHKSNSSIHHQETGRASKLSRMKLVQQLRLMSQLDTSDNLATTTGTPEV